MAACITLVKTSGAVHRPNGRALNCDAVVTNKPKVSAVWMANRNMEIRVWKIQGSGPQIWKNRSSDRTIGLHFEVGNNQVRVENGHVDDWSHSPCLLRNNEETRIKSWIYRWYRNFLHCPLCQKSIYFLRQKLKPLCVWSMRQWNRNWRKRRVFPELKSQSLSNYWQNPTIWGNISPLF